VKKLKGWKVAILLIVDVVLINLAYLLGFYFRFAEGIPAVHMNNYWENFIFINSIYILCFCFFRLYVSLWSYASLDEFLLSIGGCVLANVITIFYSMMVGLVIPIGVNVLAGIFCVLLVVGFRMSFRVYRRMVINFSKRDKSDYKNIMVIGAGSAGWMIINEMRNRPELKCNPVAVIDDNRYKRGSTICGVKVYGNCKDIKEVAVERAVKEIIIAIPTLSVERKKEIINICKKTGCKIRIMPSIGDLIEGRVTMKQVRDVEVEDLLGRAPIVLDSEGIADYLQGNTVLVTGGGGSIGSELCRQIVRFKPKELLILDIYENNAYDLQNELRYKFPNLNLKVIIASVRDKKRLEKIFEEFKPAVVFHAAAHKHVPLMEDNPGEAVKNNIFGTLNLAECADRFGVKRFVMISTDKAVNPTNIMGASKRACEMIVQAMDRMSRTEFVAVRFGNVLGSNGSVIPLFKRQIAQGGPVTLTNKYITRYFMTIPEAAQLVLQAGAYAEGGEIFVLDMGKPVRIYDLACDLIRLSGFEPGIDIKIEVTGLRPGEKLYEELLMDEEGLGKTKHEKIFVGRPTFSDMEILKMIFDEMRFILEFGSKEELVMKMEELVPTYKRVDIDAINAESAADGHEEHMEQEIATA
jgi:FlaA1/EpsC-like NDP-sugar epimerase